MSFMLTDATARLVLNEKTAFEDGSTQQIRIWSVPQPVPPASHGYKYSLFYGRPGERLVGSTMSAARATTGIPYRHRPSEVRKAPPQLRFSPGSADCIQS
jgi:hypothetical protein